MMCDECLSNPKENASPKRKQPNPAPILIQRTIDMLSPNMQFSKNVTNTSTPPKTMVIKQQNLQSVIESLVDKVETQTATIVELKTSVDSMNSAISQQNTTVEKSIKINTETVSSINKVLSETPNVVKSAIKHSYAAVLKESISEGNETPRSSKRNNRATPMPSKPIRTPRTNKPVIIGTSEKVIGKPISPKQNRHNVRSSAIQTSQKAIWVSGLHRDTKEQEIETYVKDLLGVAATDQFQVRKLVKKDRELSSYSFVSFKITCSESNFDTLLNPNYWPSNSQIREFEMDRQMSNGARLNDVKSKTANHSSPENSTEQSKNGDELRTEPMEAISEQPAQ